ncbi:hypothetical protein CEXT_108551, partial [Caerostris extrusa]
WNLLSRIVGNPPDDTQGSSFQKRRASRPDGALKEDVLKLSNFSPKWDYGKIHSSRIQNFALLSPKLHVAD